MNCKEEWRPIEGWPNYEVSNLGNVQSWWKERGHCNGGPAVSDRPRLLKPRFTDDGYIKVALYRRESGKRIRKQFLVHKLILEAFVGPRPDGMEACHGPGGPGDNRVENLRWDTHSQNVRDSFRREANRAAKLTPHEIPHVWDALVAAEPLTSIAKRFGVTAGAVHAIKTGHTWSEITSLLPGWPLVIREPDDRPHVFAPDEIIKSPVEIWRPVSGLLGYRVSSWGRVQSAWKQSGKQIQRRGWIVGDEWRDLKFYIDRGGYLTFRPGIRSGNYGGRILVHVAVLEAFAGPRPPGMVACHGPDNTRTNCHVGNLRWDTPKENARDRYRHACEDEVA